MTPALIGANLRWWRERRGLTQEELSRRVGPRNARAWLTRIENGHSPQLNPVLLYRYADALEIPFPFIFRADAGDPYLAAILDALPQLTPYNRRILLEVLQDLSQRKAA